MGRGEKEASAPTGDGEAPWVLAEGLRIFEAMNKIRTPNETVGKSRKPFPN